MLLLKELESALVKLPVLLQRPDIWQTSFINYEKPFVERVWCEYANFRLNLHCIHPCSPEESFFHPHPWPSAMKVFKGTYQMDIGYGDGNDPPPVAATTLLSPGSCYQMVNIDSWHSVCPIDNPVISVMITGKPWNRGMPKYNKGEKILLSEERKQEILLLFGDLV